MRGHEQPTTGSGNAASYRSAFHAPPNPDTRGRLAPCGCRGSVAVRREGPPTVSVPSPAPAESPAAGVLPWAGTAQRLLLACVAAGSGATCPIFRRGLTKQEPPAHQPHAVRKGGEPVPSQASGTVHPRVARGHRSAPVSPLIHPIRPLVIFSRAIGCPEQWRRGLAVTPGSRPRECPR